MHKTTVKEYFFTNNKFYRNFTSKLANKNMIWMIKAAKKTFILTILLCKSSNDRNYSANRRRLNTFNKNCGDNFIETHWEPWKQNSEIAEIWNKYIQSRALVYLNVLNSHFTSDTSNLFETNKYVTDVLQNNMTRDALCLFKILFGFINFTPGSKKSHKWNASHHLTWIC